MDLIKYEELDKELDLKKDKEINERLDAIQTVIVKLTGEFCLFKDGTLYMPDEALDFITDEMEQKIKGYCSSITRIVYTSGIGLIK